MLGLMVHRSHGPGPFDPDEAGILARAMGVSEDRAEIVRAIFDAKVDAGETVEIQEWHRGRWVDVLAAGRQALRSGLLDLLAPPRGDLPAAAADHP
ncbi:hypothetical protein MMR14E_13245 [Methylobacterium mesophilicum]